MKNKITDNIFNVGVLNPNIRVADIVVKTNNGTSYNSYIVKGSDKTALIETAHKDYFENYLKNIQEIISIDQIDYIIMNHNEPDHSGSISKLIELNPNLTIVTSPAGAIYLKNITNKTDLNIKIVKDGDSLNLGNKTLKFISAPFSIKVVNTCKLPRNAEYKRALYPLLFSLFIYDLSSEYNFLYDFTMDMK